MNRLRSWLGLDAELPSDHSALRDVIDALEHLDDNRARHLAAFAYLLGRVAHADRHVSPEETATMEALVRKEGQLSQEQAMLVVSLAKTNNRLFGGTEDFVVARDFSATATYDEKLALVRCLFAVSIIDESISTAEEGEIHRIGNELRVLPEDLVKLRLAHQQHLPGLSRKRPAER